MHRLLLCFSVLFIHSAIAQVDNLPADVREDTLSRLTLADPDILARSLSEARARLDEDATIEAQTEAIEANRLSPNLIPAAVMAARSHIVTVDEINIDGGEGVGIVTKPGLGLEINKSAINPIPKKIASYFFSVSNDFNLEREPIYLIF